MKLLKIEKKKWNERKTQTSDLSGGPPDGKQWRQKKLGFLSSSFFSLAAAHHHLVAYKSITEKQLNRKLLSLNLNVINSYTKIYCPIQNLLTNLKVADT